MVLAVLVTLTALFYLEEDWRGKRAWDQCKARLEASGIPMDWNQFIPPAVPDDQNFFMTSTNFLQRFKKAQTDAEHKAATNNPWLQWLQIREFPTFRTTKTNPLLVASIVVSPSTPSLNHDADLLIKSGQPDLAEQVQGLLQKHLGRSCLGAEGFTFSEFPLSNLPPVRITLNTETSPSLADLTQVIPKDLVTNLGQLQVEATGDGRFQVLLTGTRVTTIADYLRWSDQYVPALNEVREALKRPYAVLPGDYSMPYFIPIPDFVTLRFIAQTLAQRAQCDFLLNRPDQALRELTLMHDLCRILQKPPTGKPETLVEAMINVAINGLYTQIIAEGMQQHVWQEPQLAALQAQLRDLNLPFWVSEAFRGELLYSTYVFEHAPAEKFLSFDGQNKQYSIWTKLQNPLYRYLKFAPTGWRYQNMVTMASVEPELLAAFDQKNGTISPGFFDEYRRQLDQLLAHKSPFTRLAAFAIPNFAKAVQTTTYNQTLVNEAQIACALERCQLARHEYPATLAELVPQYLATLPHDLIGGAPLHYRRTNNGKFLLYSIGWNETDDNGRPGALSDVKQGDWVWKN